MVLCYTAQVADAHTRGQEGVLWVNSRYRNRAGTFLQESQSLVPAASRGALAASTRLSHLSSEPCSARAPPRSYLEDTVHPATSQTALPHPGPRLAACRPSLRTAVLLLCLAEGCPSYQIHLDASRFWSLEDPLFWAPGPSSHTTCPSVGAGVGPDPGHTAPCTQGPQRECAEVWVGGAVARGGD